MAHPARAISATGWQPILEGIAQACSWAMVEQIARDLRPASFIEIEDDAELAVTDATLNGGKAGLAIFYAYLDAAHPNDGHAETASRCLNAAMRAAAAWPMSEGLYDGFAGVAWAVTHLGPHLVRQGQDADTALCKEMDAVITQSLSRSHRFRLCDLMMGLAGLGVYAMERWPRETAQTSAELVCARLAESAIRDETGIFWRIAPESLPESARAIFPQGCCDLGVAHGMAGIIAWLAMADVAGVRQARELLDGAASWLLGQRFGDARRGHFPRVVGPDVTAQFAPLAWCSGDAGIAAALLVIAQRVNQPIWEREAITMLRDVARHDFTTIQDPGLCHGAAGLGHIFNRAFQTTGDETFRVAAQRCFARVFALWEPSAGVAGYPAKEDDEWVLMLRRGLLNGAAGVGLALLAACTPVEPKWDRLMLMSIGRMRVDGSP